MPIEGSGQDEEQKENPDSEYDSAFDAPTESLELSFDEPDVYSLYKAKSLCSIAAHIDWLVSIRKILYRGIEYFEEQLQKQLHRHMEVQLLDGLCIELKIEKSRISPPYKKDRIQRSIKKQKQQIAKCSEEDIFSALKKYATKAGITLPEAVPLNPLPEPLLKKIWFAKKVKEIAKKASHIGWMDFEASEIFTIDSLFELYLTLERQKEEREVMRLRNKLKQESGYEQKASESFDTTSHISLLQEKEIIEQQLALFVTLNTSRKKLPIAEREQFPLPAFPLKESVVVSYVDEVQLHYSSLLEAKERRGRIFRLLRLAAILISLVAFSGWQFNLRFEIENLSLRAAEIGLPLNAPDFPYTNQSIGEIRYFVETQEKLYPKMQLLQSKAVRSGLKRLPFKPPYTQMEYQTWSKALDSFHLERIPSGDASIGSEYGFVDERPIFTAKISRDVLFMDTEVSQSLYRAVMNTNPNVKQSCLDCPVTNVEWMDTILFANQLSTLAGLETCYEISSGTISWKKGVRCLGFRLPTEAEWEYAARAKSSYTYSGAMDSTQVAWFNGNSGQSVKPVRQLHPNDFRLYDMTGSVWEWCWDRYGPYAAGVFTDPIGSRTGENHVIRGGSFKTGLTTVSSRAEHDPEKKNIDVGFRVVRTAIIGNLPKEME